MSFDALTLSRVQFALTIMFHYLFPPLSIGLGTILVVMEGLYLKTGNRVYEGMTRFWTKIFAVNFAVGVATGIVMEFQFGTNWSRYSRFVGDIFGSALAAEGIFAFFLESGFLSVLVFGWDRVSPRMHFFSTCMVALGSIFSAAWIVIANSWQQTPAGYRLVEHAGVMRAEISDYWAMIFNPSSMHRLVHVLLGAWILGGFFVMSVSAWYVLRRRFEDFARRAFTIGLGVATIASCAMLVSGHGQARKVAFTQPAKLAAFEGHYKTEARGTPLYLFGWPNDKTERVDAGISIPGMLSFLVYNDPSRPVTALDQFPPEDRPPVKIPFLSYHLMIAIGMAAIGLTLLALILRLRNRLFEKRWLMWIFVFAVIGPYLANEAGWVSAEVGRQPWVVYGLLRTKDAHSPTVPAIEIAASIGMFSFLYFLLFMVWVYALNSKIQHGPDPADLAPASTSTEDLLDAASSRVHPTPYSLTDAKPHEGGEPDHGDAGPPDEPTA
jgi:cytochrome d ubiquinol oxidase subunit I